MKTYRSALGKVRAIWIKVWKMGARTTGEAGDIDKASIHTGGSATNAKREGVLSLGTGS